MQPCGRISGETKAMKLEKVVPWGRSFDEYRAMFALSEADLKRRILGCADGPASFNAELTRRGGSVISCDPIYLFSADEIRHRIAATSQQIAEYTRENPDEFVWSTEIPGPDALMAQRLKAMNRFLHDYEPGRQQGRYVAGKLPQLVFADRTFDIAVCSHFLFLYSEQFSVPFHVEAIRTLTRVAKEVRIFPLLELSGEPSRHVAAAATALRQAGYRVKIDRVDYEFQRGGDRMMRIAR